MNDNAPVFSSATYATALGEDTPVGTAFFQLEAADPDEGPNGTVDYWLDEEDAFVRMGKFRLDSSGTLRVNAALDRESVAEWVI